MCIRDRHIIDADLVMQTIADVLKKVAEYSISNREEFEALVRKNLDMQQTDKLSLIHIFQTVQSEK